MDIQSVPYDGELIKTHVVLSGSIYLTHFPDSAANMRMRIRRQAII